MKVVSGKIVALAMGKEGNKSILITTKSNPTPLDAETAKMLAGKDAKPAVIVELIQSSKRPSFDKVWVSRKLIAHQVHGDSGSPVRLDDVKGKEFYCEFHQEGDILSDGDAVTKSDILVNNDTVVIS